MIKHYVFYDFETSGISPAFDQPLQFAAIITDESLKELAPVDIRCRIAPHVLPSPYAMDVTGVAPEQLLDTNLQNYFEFSLASKTLVNSF